MENTEKLLAGLLVGYLIGMFPADEIARKVAAGSMAGSWPLWLHVAAVVAWPIVPMIVVLIAALGVVMGWSGC